MNLLNTLLEITTQVGSIFFVEESPFRAEKLNPKGYSKKEVMELNSLPVKFFTMLQKLKKC